jgi:hypothetical protein
MSDARAITPQTRNLTDDPMLVELADAECVAA